MPDCSQCGTLSLLQQHSQWDDFRKMSPAELLAYNRTVEFWDQVYCADEIRAGTHIRRRYCETYIELQDRLTNAASSLNVLSTTRIY